MCSIIATNMSRSKSILHYQHETSYCSAPRKKKNASLLLKNLMSIVQSVFIGPFEYEFLLCTRILAQLSKVHTKFRFTLKYVKKFFYEIQMPKQLSISIKAA